MSSKKVTYVDLPPQSSLNDFISEGDFVDCVFSKHENPNLTIEQIAKAAFGKMPKWVTNLMKTRNGIVGIFGLKTGGVGGSPESMPEQLKVGDKLGVFRIYEIREDEMILGENDKHLDFRISLLKYQGGCVLSTWVRTHNIFGKAYLAIVMPFHRLITQHTAKRLMSA